MVASHWDNQAKSSCSQYLLLFVIYADVFLRGIQEDATAQKNEFREDLDRTVDLTSLVGALDTFTS